MCHAPTYTHPTHMHVHTLAHACMRAPPPHPARSPLAAPHPTPCLRPSPNQPTHAFPSPHPQPTPNPPRFLTGSIEDVSSETKLSQAFLGMIVLPIAGNACEHITAVVVATKNKMDLSLGVAVGSSIQIALVRVLLSLSVCVCVCMYAYVSCPVCVWGGGGGRTTCEAANPFT